jgi:putative transposase
VKLALKIPLLVNSQITNILDGQSRIANWLYNHLLEKANILRKAYIQNQDSQIALTLYSERGLRNLVPEIKHSFPFVKTLYSSVSKNVALRLSSSIREYQKSRRGERKAPTAWPRFRAWKQKWFSLLYDEPWKGYNLQGRKLHLSLGKDESGKQIKVSVELNEKTPQWFNPDQVAQLRITKESDVFFAIFTVNRDLPSIGTIHTVIALDPNHQNLSYGVDNNGVATEIANPYFLKSLDKRIDALRSRRDRCSKKSRKIIREDGSSFWLPSRRWLFFHQRLQQLYHQRREQTKTFLYTVANRLFRQYDAVALGDYCPHGGGLSRKMRRAMNNQSLIGRWKHILSWVATRFGKTFVIWPEKGSTRTCHNCHHIVKDGIAPGIRSWICPTCSLHHIRDENAAINGLHRSFQQLKLPCSGRQVEVSSRRAWWFTGLGVLETPGTCDRQKDFSLLSPAKKLKLNV